MSPTDDIPDRLNICRLRAQYLVPANHPRPESVRARLDDSIRDVRRAFGQTLSTAPGGDPSVWIVRALQVQFDVNASSPRDSLERQWADHLSRRLRAVLRGDGDGHNAIRFPDRAAYLASFLADTASGVASTAWYYRPFEGLRLLATADALRTAICRHPPEGLGALLRLPPARLTQVLRAVTDRDAASILGVFARVNDAPDADPVRCFETLRTILQQLRCEAIAPLSEPREALRLFLHAARTSSPLQGVTLADMAAAVARIEHRLGGGDRALLRAFDCEGVADLYLAVGVADGQVVRPLLAVAPEIRRRLLATLAPPTTAPAAPAHTPLLHHTLFGGLLILLPRLDDMPLEAATRTWPRAARTRPANILRLLILAKCSGVEHAGHAFQDPVVRRLLDVPDDFSAKHLARWQQRLRAPWIRRLLTRVSAHHRDSGSIEGRGLWRNLHRISAARKPDLRHLSAPLDLRPVLETAVIVLAQNLLRGFAWRLPGFARSHLPYLYANFLDFPATLQEDDVTRVVRLGRPPLHLLLSLTGVNRATHSLSWSPGHVLALYPQE